MDEYSSLRVQSATRPRSSLRFIAGTIIAAFALGAAATWLLLRPEGVVVPEIVEIRSETTATPDTEQLVPSDSEREDLDQRIAEMEQRLARIDIQAEAAAGNAVRAEGLLIVSSARRAIERGDQLGYLADQLRLRFGVAQPNAVRAVLAAGSDPVTIDQLLSRLDALAPRLGEAPQDESTAAWLSRELGELFVVRREGTPSPAPERRLERARLFLQSGRAGAAAREIRNLPNAGDAGDWVADAERYAAAQRGLEVLEAAAILEPRELRDGAGEPVAPSNPPPAGTPTAAIP
jgi:hypothetical protein